MMFHFALFSPARGRARSCPLVRQLKIFGLRQFRQALIRSLVVPGESESEMRGDELCLVLTECKIFKVCVSVIHVLICEIPQKISLKTREQLLFSLPTTSSGRQGVKRTINWKRMILKSFLHTILPPFGNSPIWNLVQSDLVLMFPLIWWDYQGTPGYTTEIVIQFYVFIKSKGTHS